MRKQTYTVSKDVRQRVCLNKVLSKEEQGNFSNFKVKVLNALLKGLKDAEEDRIYDLGSFAGYVDGDDEV